MNSIKIPFRLLSSTLTLLVKLKQTCSPRTVSLHQTTTPAYSSVHLINTCTHWIYLEARKLIPKTALAEWVSEWVWERVRESEREWERERERERESYVRKRSGEALLLPALHLSTRRCLRDLRSVTRANRCCHSYSTGLLWHAAALSPSNWKCFTPPSPTPLASSSFYSYLLESFKKLL